MGGNGRRGRTFAIVDGIRCNHVRQDAFVGRPNLLKWDLVQAGPTALDDGDSHRFDDRPVRGRYDLRSLRTVESRGRNGQRKGGVRLEAKKEKKKRKSRTHDMTMPWNLCPTRKSCINCNRASFLPLHLRGSQWSKSFRDDGVKSFSERLSRARGSRDDRLTHMATGTLLCDVTAG